MIAELKLPFRQREEVDEVVVGEVVRSAHASVALEAGRKHTLSVSSRGGSRGCSLIRTKCDGVFLAVVSMHIPGSRTFISSSSWVVFSRSAGGRSVGVVARSLEFILLIIVGRRTTGGWTGISRGLHLSLGNCCMSGMPQPPKPPME